MLRKKIFLNFNFFLFSFFLIGCGNIVVYNNDGSIQNLSNTTTITKKSFIDNKINYILQVNENNGNIIESLNTLNKDILYNGSLYDIKNQNILYKNSNGYNIICLSIINDDKELFDFLLKHAKNKTKILNYESSNGCTLLKLAIYKGKYDYFRELLKQKDIKIDVRYVKYALRFNRNRMAYDLLNKIYHNNIPIDIFIKYAKQNKKFKKEILDSYFKDELIHKIITLNDLNRVIRKLEKLNLSKNQIINFYSLLYKQKRLLANNKYTLEILLSSDSQFKNAYNNLHILQKYINKLKFKNNNDKIKYKLAYHRFIELKLQKLNTINSLEKFIKTCKTNYCRLEIKNKIKDLKFKNVMEELKRTIFYYKFDSIEWKGNIDSDGWPNGRGKFKVAKILGKGFLSNIYINMDIYVTFRHHHIDSNANNYIEYQLFKSNLLFTNALSSKKRKSFSGVKSMNDVIYNAINSEVRQYKYKHRPLNDVCKKIFDTCMKSCEYKSQKGFFDDQSSCREDCFSAKNYCQKGNYHEAKRMSCRGICLGLKKYNGGLFGTSDYDKCVDRCSSK